MIIDLRSDTVTQPTKAMLKAMFTAKVGDDVYKEDPSVNALEEELADLFKKPKALFFPTGTMANQVALKLHTNPGDQVICDTTAHIYNYEGGGASFNSGISCKLISGNRGMFTAKQVQESINPPDFYHSPLSRLVALENTTNKGGGACWSVQEIQAIQKVCKTHKLEMHLDGARIWNALVATKELPETFGALFSTISVCLSKGLGCPAGSVLVGTEAIMENALRLRKILGGGMRQIGYLAAAGSYALKNHITRLAEDHERAKELETILLDCSYIKKVLPVETNIVIFELVPHIKEQEFISKLARKGIYIIGMGDKKMRIVTHLNYTAAMHLKMKKVVANLFQK